MCRFRFPKFFKPQFWFSSTFPVIFWDLSFHHPISIFFRPAANHLCVRPSFKNCINPSANLRDTSSSSPPHLTLSSITIKSAHCPTRLRRTIPKNRLPSVGHFNLVWHTWTDDNQEKQCSTMHRTPPARSTILLRGKVLTRVRLGCGLVRSVLSLVRSWCREPRALPPRRRETHPSTVPRRRNWCRSGTTPKCGGDHLTKLG